MNYAKYITRISAARRHSAIRILSAIVQENPSLITMAGGMPNPQTFPLLDASLTLRDGTKIDLDAKAMKTALQYLPTKGFQPLINFINDLQFKIHNPPTYKADDHPGQMDVIITTGSQDGLCKAFEAMVTENDNILVELPAYSGTLAIVKPITSNIIPVESDMNGLNPSSLRQALSRWSPSEARKPGSDAPKLLYLVPNGGNPTGVGLTLDRKKEIYKIAQEYDLIILEDDPYFYLQFTKPFVPSFLSMDTDGRVVRFDSFSKIISSGMRLGFVTGPQPLVERLELHSQCSVMHASGISQMILHKILENWGLEGFLKHTENTVEFYKNKRDQCLKTMEKHLSGLAEWSVPSGGMFVWIRLNVEDSYKLVTVKARKKEVLFVPGNVFMLDNTKPCPYIRASYSNCTEEQMDIAFQRLAEILREEN
ncbi:kynurenine/alpha-aminoadipate aminotransferase, mitochondrial-like isoform X2 [Saccostrea echinata]|uniref:kynurenine/alpha-aminoadipate aminotransferase, mitochondrial-like isoform X2 n=1 Tax=Saccostrea echinata TaxID=191078 RepID=UPI002A839F20|nr:kynurenine/alpha-aminoadipate aminotransferase, mitochondrial-like isoform X2 [Saccostrea echinata]